MLANSEVMFNDYPVNGHYYDELLESPGVPRGHYQTLYKSLLDLPPEEMDRRKQASDLSFLHQGITFTVYDDEQGTERTFPFDLLPRIITAGEWDTIERGLKQRIIALNMFLKDIYHDRRVFSDKIVPYDLIATSKHYRSVMRGVSVPRDVYVGICGTDLVRVSDGRFVVLEDNLRVPSGVSYMLANRQVAKRVFPRLFDNYSVRPIDHYGRALLKTLRSLSQNKDNPLIVLLTPGVFNSAYYEHTFLARQMGIEVVEGRDLMVHDGIVYIRTTDGPQRVDVIYRRIDDDFIDPLAFRADSTLGAPGLFNAYCTGNITMVNAIGTGVADDKAVYTYIPALIRYYLDQDPILDNVETMMMLDDQQRKHVLGNIGEYVLKAVGESGGYDMLIGPHASKQQQKDFAHRVSSNPRNYVAQPVLPLSTAPCYLDGRIQPRHLDLRPFVLYDGEEVTIVPGGLSRVALREGSLVVNSSQGGGSKDTWVLS
jgi:uncharacterized circularly permuted ATP-grasp superfamily protein